MSRRVLIACVGNIFLGDDAWGVEVARRLTAEQFPPGTTVKDFGISGVHLVYELLEPPDLLVLVDATARNGDPGTIYVIDPSEHIHASGSCDAHTLDPYTVLATVVKMGGTLPRTRIVGCEPADLSEGMSSLSEPVRGAIEPAIAIIRRIVEQEVAS